MAESADGDDAGEAEEPGKAAPEEQDLLVTQGDRLLKDAELIDQQEGEIWKGKSEMLRIEYSKQTQLQNTCKLSDEQVFRPKYKPVLQERGKVVQVQDSIKYLGSMKRLNVPRISSASLKP